MDEKLHILFSNYFYIFLFCSVHCTVYNFSLPTFYIKSSVISRGKLIIGFRLNAAKWSAFTFETMAYFESRYYCSLIAVVENFIENLFAAIVAYKNPSQERIKNRTTNHGCELYTIQLVRTNLCSRQYLQQIHFGTIANNGICICNYRRCQTKICKYRAVILAYKITSLFFLLKFRYHSV